MSNLYEYKALTEPSLHSRIFLNDPRLLDSNVYMNRDFSATLQQLFLVRNWKLLTQTISQEELWAMLKLHEYRGSTLVFDSNSGNLIADKNSQQLYKKFYFNSIWLPAKHNDDGGTNISKFFSINSALFCIVLLVVFYCLCVTWLRQRRRRQQSLFIGNSLLDALEQSTKAQQNQ